MPEPEPLDGLAEALGDTDDLRFFRAPGRVNLMGDHTDYNDGFVLPVAVDRECTVAVRPRDDVRMVTRSLDLDGAVSIAADGSDDPRAIDPPWGRLVAGVVAALTARGRPAVGADLAVTSTVPLGSGLSSSAAFEVAVALALCDVVGFELSPAELALACQAAEHLGTDVPCGVMDQLASACGVAGAALLIDCRTLGVLPVAIPPDVSILVVHSGGVRELAATPYAERRGHCEETARHLGLRALRDASYEQVADDPIARHVVTENARVAAAALGLAAGDLAALGDVFTASHASLRDDFGCSTPELDELVERLVGAGAIGARLTGAGWGGCVVALVTRDHLDAVVGAVAHLEHWVCRAVDGAGPVER